MKVATPRDAASLLIVRTHRGKHQVLMGRRPSKDRFMPDIYEIGLQEIVKLNTKNILIKDKKKVEMWTSMLNQTLI